MEMRHHSLGVNDEVLSGEIHLKPLAGKTLRRYASEPEPLMLQAR